MMIPKETPLKSDYQPETLGLGTWRGEPSFSTCEVELLCFVFKAALATLILSFFRLIEEILMAIFTLHDCVCPLLIERASIKNTLYRGHVP